jgi:heme/copper-type cytochrome/quinol oxidase subunit 2
MSKKIIISAIVIGFVAVIAAITLNNTNQAPEAGNIESNTQNNNVTEVARVAPENKEQVVKEFTMDSFVEFVDGKPKPQFSLKEITVNKGDLVRLKITVTSGRHDFKLDEFSVFADTPLNQETVVEFTADKAGDFIYYCNQPGHRANGHWGTLKVLE